MTACRTSCIGMGLTREGGGSSLIQAAWSWAIPGTTLPATSRRGFWDPRLAISAETVRR